MPPPITSVSVWDLQTDEICTFSSLTEVANQLLYEPKEIRRAMLDFPRVRHFYGKPAVVAADRAQFKNLIPEIALTACEFSLYREGRHCLTDSRIRRYLGRLGKDLAWYASIVLPRLEAGENEITVSDTATVFFHPKGAIPTHRYRIFPPKKAV